MRASKLAVLRKCPDMVSAILKRGGSLLLASKILVLSRLLHKKLSAQSEAPAFVEKIRHRLGGLRQRLLNTVDQRMASLETESTSLVDAMCAFSLATSSSCMDVLRHFHHIRLSAISTGFQQESIEGIEAVRCLQIWIRTMQDTQSFFPRQVSSALAKLKSIPLLRDKSLRDVQDFDLDIHEAWMDEDVKNFTPYVRHDDITGHAAAQALSSWSPMALASYVEGLEAWLSSIEDFQQILSLRTSSFHVWLSSKGRLVGTSKSEALDLLRSKFQKRLHEILKAQTNGMERVTSMVHKIIKGWNPSPDEAKVPSLWDDGLIKADISRGAHSLTDELRCRLQGQTEDVSQIMGLYEVWLVKTNGTSNAITTLKSLKWEIEDFDDDEDDFEDVEDMRFRIEKEDPSDLENGHRSCVDECLKDLVTAFDLEREGFVEGQTPIGKASFLLRITREVKQQLPDGIQVQHVDFSFVQHLHRLVAQTVAHNIIKDHRQAIVEAATRMNIPGRLLWDGDPELPVVPSPWSYRLLNDLLKALGETGADIWTKRAVDSLKACLRQLISDELGSIEDTRAHSQNAAVSSELEDSNSTVNGETHTEGQGHEQDDEAGNAKDIRIQLLFDAQYLAAALLPSEAESNDSLHDYCTQLARDLDLSYHLQGRIEASSKDYWKRTSLLFSLLAQT